MENIITHKEWLEIFPEAREYLEEELNYQLNKFDKQIEKFNWQLDMIEGSGFSKNQKQFWTQVSDAFIGEDIKETEKKIKEIYRYLRKDNPTNGITQEDIERAKEYPFEQLINLRNGFALCPFHKDTSPSFYVKNNWGYCFSCGKAVDTIQFLIETEGLNFIQAVNILK